MRRVIVAAIAFVSAACGSHSVSEQEDTATSGIALSAQASAAEPAAAAPDLVTCPPRDPVDEGLRQRNQPIPVPAALREVMRSDMDDFAFSTLEGATVCVESSWMESIREPALSPDKRFASFSWDGYESYGHIVVDRTRKGIVVDTGVPPIASPSGSLLAAADLSESGFGALNAFAVWRIEPAAIRQLAKHDAAPEATDWRIDGWGGETCVNLTAVPWEGYGGEAGASRNPYHARDSNGWRIEPGPCA